MNDSIELYDEMHLVARATALTIDEANEAGCNFLADDATKAAFSAFAEQYEEFCEEQNAVEGEPFAQETPSLEPHMALFKATKKATRRLRIGTKAPPVLDFTERTQRSVVKPPAPRAMLLRQAAKPKQAAELAEQLAPVAKLAAPATPAAMKVTKTPETVANFGAYVAQKAEQNSLYKNALFFLPDNCDKQLRKEGADFVNRHGFSNKHEVIKQIQLWKSYMQKGDVKGANRVTIRSLTGNDTRVGTIGFSFKSFKKYCLGEIRMVSMMAGRTI